MIVDIAELKVVLGLASRVSDADIGLMTLLQPQAEQAIVDELRYDPVWREATEYYPRNETAALGGGDVEADYEVSGNRAVLVSKARSGYLQLERLPVRAVATVYVDNDGRYGQTAGAFVTDRLWTPGEQYYLEQEQDGYSRSGCLIARSGWPAIPGSVKVTYTAGYTADEFAGRAASRISGAGIKTACMITLVKAFKQFKAHQISSRAGAVAGVVTSERLGDYNYAIDPSIAAMLTAFKVNVPPEAMNHLQPYRHYGLMVL